MESQPRKIFFYIFLMDAIEKGSVVAGRVLLDETR